MKWIIDAQLPPKLNLWLVQQGEEATHVFELPNGVSMPDIILWKYAKEHQSIIVSKDKDFFDYAMLMGSPPQTVFVSVGNCSNEHLITLFKKSFADIVTRLQNNSPLIVVTQHDIYSY